MFIISRLAHYLKVIQRENIGTWKERVDLEKELNVKLMKVGGLAAGLLL